MEENLIIYKTDRPVTFNINGQYVTFTQVEIVDGKSSNTDTTLLFTNNGEYQVLAMPWNEFFNIRNKLNKA